MQRRANPRRLGAARNQEERDISTVPQHNVNAAFKCRSASEVEMSHFFFLMEPLERSDRLAFELAQACQPEAGAFGCSTLLS